MTRVVRKSLRSLVVDDRSPGPVRASVPQDGAYSQEVLSGRKERMVHDPSPGEARSTGHHIHTVRSLNGVPHGLRVGCLDEDRKPKFRGSGGFLGTLGRNRFRLRDKKKGHTCVGDKHSISYLRSPPTQTFPRPTALGYGPETDTLRKTRPPEGHGVLDEGKVRVPSGTYPAALVGRG